MVRMEISAVYNCSPEASQPQVVLKQVDGDNYLPIVIGRFEAAAISMAQNEDVPARPISYDLVRQILVGMECHVSKVEITELHESTYFADVHVTSSDGTVRVFDARPSDAIAMALRFDAPIFAAPEVLSEVDIPSAQEQTSGLEEQEHGASVVAIFDPYVEGPASIQMFADVEESAEYLTWKRSKL